MYSDLSGHFAITLTFLAWAVVALYGLAMIGYIETQFHPIENTFRAIGDGINYLINDVDWEDVGNSIGWFLSDIGNGVSTWWDSVFFSKSRGGGRDSGFIDFPNNPTENQKLEDLMNEARKAGKFELANRILRELKNRGWRNKKKKRGGPVKSILWLLFPEIMRRLFDRDDY